MCGTVGGTCSEQDPRNTQDPTTTAGEKFSSGEYGTRVLVEADVQNYLYTNLLVCVCGGVHRRRQGPTLPRGRGGGGPGGAQVEDFGI